MDAESKESLLKTLILQDDSLASQRIRNDYYKSVLGFMGEHVKIGRNVKIVNPQWVRLHDNVTIDDDSTLIARGEGGIEIGANVHINHRVYLDTESAATGYITIGHHTYIGTGTTLFGHKGLEIGHHVLMAQNITLTPYSHIFDDPSRCIIEQGGHCEKVTIGNDVYVGMRCAIMYSGNIGDGSIIGAGSVVVKSIPPYSVAVGCPAKVIKQRG